MSEGEVIYQCLRCGTKASLRDWERTVDLPDWEKTIVQMRGQGLRAGGFKCPNCGYKVSRKLRPPIVKRVKAV